MVMDDLHKLLKN